MQQIDLQQGLVLYLILLASLSVHEWAHAIVADRLGDHTPRSQGRVTLNPVAHIDPIGTVLLPLMMIFFPFAFAIFGYGKPVQVNPRNFSKPVRDDLLVSMAGPASNLSICLLVSVIGGIALAFVAHREQLENLLDTILFINVLLTVFNLIPIPPLDGSHVLKHAIGMSDETYYNFARWGILIILVAINIPPFRYLLWNAMRIVMFPFARLVDLISGLG